MKQLKLLWKYTKGNRMLYLGAIISVMLAAFFSFIGPLVLRFTIDSIIGDKVMDAPESIINLIDGLGGKSKIAKNLWMAGVILLSLAILEGIFLYLKGKWSAMASESIAKKLRDSLYDHLQNLPFNYYVNAKTGDLIQRCTSDLDTLRRFLGIQLVEIGRTIFMIGMAMYFMLSISVKMTLVAMAAVPIMVLFSTMFFIKIQKAFKASDEAEGDMSTTLQENLSGVRVVRAFAKERHEIDKFDKKNTDYRDITYNLIKNLAYFWSSTDFMSIIQVGALTVYGIVLAVNGEITLGTLVMFISYERMLLWPVRQLGRILTDMGKSFVSLGRIQEILDEEREVYDESGKTPEINGDIEFEDVSFNYGDNDKILKNISFNIDSGETLAILGATGSGKTTLVNLLPRFYDYEEGSIKIDGIDIKDINKKWLRENIGIVLQEPFMFSKTVRDNLNLASQRTSEDDIYESAKIASVHDVIEAFDDGYKTSIGEKGVTLSGGQKQRLAIARTLLKDSPILIFDDSLSAVDTQTDATIRRALKSRNSDTTTIIISHRITTLAEADKIIVLDDGEIVQEGTHRELIREDGFYKRTWEIQNKIDEEELKEISSPCFNFDENMSTKIGY